MYVYYLPITFSKWEQIDTYLFNYVSPERQDVDGNFRWQYKDFVACL